MQSIGYTYNEETDKWTISDAAADYVFTGNQVLPFALPGTLKVLFILTAWEMVTDAENEEQRSKILSDFFQDSGFASRTLKASPQFCDDRLL